MVKEKNNTKFVIAIVILSLIVVALFTYVICDKVIFNKSNDIEENNQKELDKESEDKNDKIYDTVSLDFSTCDFSSNNICTKESGKFNISIVENDVDGMSTYTIKINNKEALSDVLYYSNKFDILDDNVVVFDTTLTDVRSTTLYAYDDNGNQILNVKSLDTDYPTMVLDEIEYSINHKIENNKIIVNGTRLSNGSSLVVDDNSENIDTCANKEKYYNEVVEGTYEIEYIGDKEFSKIKNTSYKTLGETNYCK